MPPLQFNTTAVSGQPYAIFWRDSTKTAYVVTQSSPVLFDWGFTTIDYSGPSPVSGGAQASGPVTFNPRGQSHVQGTPLGPFFAHQLNFPGSCIDDSGLIWMLSGDVIFQPHQPTVTYVLAYDPTTGDNVQQITSYTGLPADEYFPFGIYSFRAGGVNYIWVWISHIVHSFANTPQIDIVVFNPAAPSYNANETSLDIFQAFYPAPIFDDVQFAYVLINMGEIDEDSGIVEEDTGAFSLVKFDVSGGGATQVGNYTYSSGVGRAVSGLYDATNELLILFTTHGALLTFDPSTGQFDISAPAGTFASVDRTNSDRLADVFYYNGASPAGSSVIGPTFAADSQVNRADVLNCTLFGISPNTAIAQNNYFSHVNQIYGGLRRLNLFDLSFLDDHFPQQNWLSGSTNPTLMITSGFVQASSINSLLFMDATTNNVYQLKWPSQGNCAAAVVTPVSARQPNTFTIT